MNSSISIGVKLYIFHQIKTLINAQKTCINASKGKKNLSFSRQLVGFFMITIDRYDWLKWEIDRASVVCAYTDKRR